MYTDYHQDGGSSQIRRFLESVLLDPERALSVERVSVEFSSDYDIEQQREEEEEEEEEGDDKKIEEQNEDEGSSDNNNNNGSELIRPRTITISQRLHRQVETDAIVASLEKLHLPEEDQQVWEEAIRDNDQDVLTAILLLSLPHLKELKVTLYDVSTMLREELQHAVKENNSTKTPQYSRALEVVSYSHTLPEAAVKFEDIESFFHLQSVRELTVYSLLSTSCDGTSPSWNHATSKDCTSPQAVSSPCPIAPPKNPRIHNRQSKTHRLLR